MLKFDKSPKSAIHPETLTHFSLAHSNKLHYFECGNGKLLSEFSREDFIIWQQRHLLWFNNQMLLTEADLRLLLEGGFIKREQHFADYLKIVSSWLGHEDYLYEQRIDYRLQPQMWFNGLGIKYIHIERDIYHHYRINLLCQSTDHYANLYSVLESEELPITTIHRYAMLPYSLEFSGTNNHNAKKLLSVIANHTDNKLAPILADLEKII